MANRVLTQETLLTYFAIAKIKLLNIIRSVVALVLSNGVVYLILN